MRLILVVVVALVASASAYVEVFGPRGYHEEIGIPLAAELKAKEDQALGSMARLLTGFDDERVVGGVVAPANSHPYLVTTFLFKQQLKLLLASETLTSYVWDFNGIKSILVLIQGTKYLFPKMHQNPSSR